MEEEIEKLKAKIKGLDEENGDLEHKLAEVTKERDEALETAKTSLAKLRELQEIRRKWNRRKARRMAREMVASGNVD